MPTAQPINQRPPRLTDFSDALRILAMLGVVAVHCTMPFSAQDSDFAFNQFGKVANGLFFFVSGYLWQFRNGSAAPGRYLRNRLKSLYLPYIVWAAITGAIVMVWFLVSGRGLDTGEWLRFVFTNTPLWFIPQLLVSLYVSSVLYRRLGKAASALLLALITLAYGMNLQVGWADIHHTEAVLGYASFCWIGYFTFDHEEQVRTVLLRLPLSLFAGAAALLWLAAFFEAAQLRSDDSLRLTNVLFTLVATAALAAIGYRRGVAWRETPRGISYGVYLIHTVILLPLALVFAYVTSDAWQQSYVLPWWANIVLRVVLVAVTWFSARAIFRIFARLGLDRLVGAPPKQVGRVEQSSKQHAVAKPTPRAAHGT